MPQRSAGVQGWCRGGAGVMWAGCGHAACVLCVVGVRARCARTCCVVCCCCFLLLLFLGACVLWTNRMMESLPGVVLSQSTTSACPSITSHPDRNSIAPPVPNICTRGKDTDRTAYGTAEHKADDSDDTIFSAGFWEFRGRSQHHDRWLQLKQPSFDRRCCCGAVLSDQG